MFLFVKHKEKNQGNTVAGKVMLQKYIERYKMTRINNDENTKDYVRKK